MQGIINYFSCPWSTQAQTLTQVQDRHRIGNECKTLILKLRPQVEDALREEHIENTTLQQPLTREDVQNKIKNISERVRDRYYGCLEQLYQHVDQMSPEEPKSNDPIIQQRFQEELRQYEALIESVRRFIEKFEQAFFRLMEEILAFYQKFWIDYDAGKDVTGYKKKLDKKLKLDFENILKSIKF